MDLVAVFLLLVFRREDEDKEEVPGQCAEHQEQSEQVHLDISLECIQARQARQARKTASSRVATVPVHLALARKLASLTLVSLHFS